MEESREKVEHGLEQTSSEAIDPEALVGVTLGGRYEVTAPIGKGGMGVVYLATQSVLNRQVVVKVLGRGLSGEGEAMQRFEREALGLSQLTHPNIVTIYDFGRDRDQAYIVMEYVDGEMLGELMARVGHMSFELFAPVAAQILAALAEAHSRGIIHRDIKPSNIMLCERHGTPNFVKVLDFGLVKLVGDAKEVTKKQSLVGSAAFLAPEQILGLEFDQRADVYALGVLFYYMLTGQKPFVGDDDIAVLYQHIHKDAPALHTLLPAHHDIPEELMELVHRCLNKEPMQRPEDAHAVLALMQGLDTRATFALPWSSGEFAAVSRESAAHARIKSGSQPSALPLVELTPVSQRQLPTLVRDSSGHYDPISDATLSRHGLSALDAQPAIVREQVIEAPSRTMALMGIALLLFLLIGGGGALMLWSQQSRDTTPLAEVSPLVAPTTQEPGERADALLVEVDALLDTSRWGQAEVLLATLKEHEPSPSLLRRVAEREDLIAVGRLLQQARAAEDNQEREQAREHYQAILARVPTHPLATQKLADFAAEDRAQAMKRGELIATSSPASSVMLDGMELGKTPLDLELEAGSYTLEFHARGHQSTSQRVTISHGEKARAHVTLLPLERKSTASTPPVATEKPTPERKDLLIPVEKPGLPTLNTTNDLLPVGN